MTNDYKIILDVLSKEDYNKIFTENKFPLCICLSELELQEIQSLYNELFEYFIIPSDVKNLLTNKIMTLVDKQIVLAHLDKIETLMENRYKRTKILSSFLNGNVKNLIFNELYYETEYVINDKKIYMLNFNKLNDLISMGSINVSKLITKEEEIKVIGIFSSTSDKSYGGMYLSQYEKKYIRTDEMFDIIKESNKDIVLEHNPQKIK